MKQFRKKAKKYFLNICRQSSDLHKQKVTISKELTREFQTQNNLNSKNSKPNHLKNDSDDKVNGNGRVEGIGQLV